MYKLTTVINDICSKLVTGSLVRFATVDDPIQNLQTSSLKITNNTISTGANVASGVRTMIRKAEIDRQNKKELASTGDKKDDKKGDKKDDKKDSKKDDK